MKHDFYDPSGKLIMSLDGSEPLKQPVTPTAELRFIERETGKTYMDEYGYFHKETRRILQQKWESLPDADFHSLEPNAIEWRDVPCVKEDES